MNKTIRAEFLQYIENNGLLLYHFAERTGINSGTLSRVVNGSQLISIRILDVMTLGMGLKEGFFYAQYLSELFESSVLNWKRLRSFMLRCAELGMNRFIEQTVDLMMENYSYIKSLFEFAELLNKEERFEAALVIYRKICEEERYQHAERLAVCQYRIFKISINDDEQNNLECALKFESYVMRLNELEQLDALKDLMNLYLSLRRWDKALPLANRIGQLARSQYELKQQRIRQGKNVQKTSKPLFGYILYSDLIKGTISEEMCDYQQALHYVSCYENQGWIVENDAEADLTKKQFKDWAHGNKHLYTISSGNFEVLDEYVDYLSKRENEILSGLFKLIRAAIRYNKNIDYVLERFKGKISSYLLMHENPSPYNERIIDNRFVLFLRDLGEYFVSSGRVREGILFVYNSLNTSNKEG